MDRSEEGTIIQLYDATSVDGGVGYSVNQETDRCSLFPIRHRFRVAMECLPKTVFKLQSRDLHQMSSQNRLEVGI